MNRVLAAIALPGEGLALFRRGLAVLCLTDAAQRLTQSSFLYSDLGVLPRSALLTLFPNSGFWSLYMISGHPWFVASLLVLTLILAARQALGRGSFWSRVALWALTLSVQHRNPSVNDAADDLLRLMLLWDIFLPEAAEEDTVSLATVGLQWQLTLASLATGLTSQRQWMLAAQWGQAAEAARLPWLGHVALLAIPSLWWSGCRRVLLPLLGGALAVQALLMDAAFPITLACGLLCLWRPSRLPRPHVVAARRWAAPAAWAAACLMALAWTATPEKIPGPLVLASEVVGLGQHWRRMYPLAESRRAEVLLRIEGYAQPVFTLDLSSGRRLRLLSQALLVDNRLAVPLAQSFAERASTPRAVAVWLKTSWLDPRLSLPRQEVRQLEAVHARPGAELEEQT